MNFYESFKKNIDEAELSAFSKDAQREVKNNGVKYYVIIVEDKDGKASEDSRYRTKRAAQNRLDDLSNQLKDGPYDVYMRVVTRAKGTDGSMEDFYEADNDYLDDVMLNIFADDYYKNQEEPREWTRDEMVEWINANPDSGITLKHLDNLLDFQHELAKQDKEALNESATDVDDWDDPNYKVDTTNLILTNGGYHNNSDLIYGRVSLIPKGDGAPAHYSILYFCENGDLFPFKLGTDVRTLADYLYKNGDGETNWVIWNGNRVQIDKIYDIINEEKINIPSEQKDAIERAVNNAYYNEEPFPLNKVNYQ